VRVDVAHRRVLDVAGVAVVRDLGDLRVVAGGRGHDGRELLHRAVRVRHAQLDPAVAEEVVVLSPGVVEDVEVLVALRVAAAEVARARKVELVGPGVPARRGLDVVHRDVGDAVYPNLDRAGRAGREGDLPFDVDPRADGEREGAGAEERPAAVLAVHAEAPAGVVVERQLARASVEPFEERVARIARAAGDHEGDADDRGREVDAERLVPAAVAVVAAETVRAGVAAGVHVVAEGVVPLRRGRIARAVLLHRLNEAQHRYVRLNVRPSVTRVKVATVSTFTRTISPAAIALALQPLTPPWAFAAPVACGLFAFAP